MPIEVMRNIVGITEGNVIIDPFAGAGTTLLACQQLDRKWIGIERDEKYCEIIKDRLSKLDIDTKIRYDRINKIK